MLNKINILKENQKYLNLLNEIGATDLEDLLYITFNIFEEKITVPEYEELSKIIETIKAEYKEEYHKRERMKISNMRYFYCDITVNLCNFSKKMIDNFMEICRLKGVYDISPENFTKLFRTIHNEIDNREQFEYKPIIQKPQIKRLHLRKICDYIGVNIIIIIIMYYFYEININIYSKLSNDLYGKCFAICIGVNEYKNQALIGANESADELGTFLKEKGFDVEKVLGMNANVINIGAALGNARSKAERTSGSNNLLIIYFSGHGYSENNNFQICPQNFDTSNIVETGQNLLNLRNRILTTFPCVNTLFIFDCDFKEKPFDG